MNGDSPAEVAARYDERSRERLHERERRAGGHRTNPLTGKLHAPLADRVTDAYDEMDVATVKLWKSEQELHRHRRAVPFNSEDPVHEAASADRVAELHRLEDARAEASLEYDLAVNEVQRLQVLVRLYDAGALAD